MSEEVLIYALAQTLGLVSSNYTNRFAVPEKKGSRISCLGNNISKYKIRWKKIKVAGHAFVVTG